MARMEQLRRVAKRDFFVFTKYVLPYKDVEEQPHKEVCSFLMNPQPKGASDLRKKLLMLPRGHFKSTIASVAYPLWRLWEDPNLAIMIDSESFKNSKKFLSELKDNIRSSELFRSICVDAAGNFLLEGNDKVPGGWTEDSIILKARTVPKKEPSIFCAGVDTAVTGMHPDIIIADDLVSERNVTTDEQMEKVKQHYRFLYSLLNPGGTLILIGTRYHMADLYGDILENESDTFDVMIRPAVLPSGELFFPARFTHEKLADLRKSQGPYIFNSQYMLNPISSDTAVFKYEWFKYFDPREIPPNMAKFITVDLAISQKQTADDTVLCVSGVDVNNNIYILDYVAGKFTPQEMIDQLFLLTDTHKNGLVKVGIETVAYQKAIIYFLRDEMRKRGKFFSLQELKADKDKVRRAMALQPWLENGAFFVQKHMTDLIDQMVKFPLAKHDDLVDAAAYIVQLISSVAGHLLDPVNPRQKVIGSSNGEWRHPSLDDDEDNGGW